MNPNEITWYQRGLLDQSCGIPFDASPAPDLFEREQWEKGWLQGWENFVTNCVLITGVTRNLMLRRLRQNKALLLRTS